MTRILFAAAEVYPFVKTGGLADAAGFLPPALHGLGLDIRVLLPGYRTVMQVAGNAEPAGVVDGYDARLLRTYLPGSEVPVYIVDAPAFFDRPGGPYQDAGGTDWPDNAQRFGLFCRVIEGMCLGRAGLDWTPDVLHCNDWHTGLAPALLSAAPARPRMVFSIHSLAYQGNFPYATFQALGLPAALWSTEGLEFHGMLSFIKGGLVYADELVTVSPTYAREITTAAFGCGLDGLLRHRGARLRGILNGVDYRIWDPRRDPLIEKPYWTNRLAGKQVNKLALQRELGLDAGEQRILLAHIARLTEQKGIDLIIAVLPALMRGGDVQLAILGAGEHRYEEAVLQAARRYPGRIAVHLGYDEALAHRIQAGADMMLLPSRFEPCGLTQLYSLRYGTVPVVRSTGGLVDTVVDAAAQNPGTRAATGFRFAHPVAGELAAATLGAVAVYRSGKNPWQDLMRAGMRQEFSWEESARQHAALFKELLN